MIKVAISDVSSGIIPITFGDSAMLELSLVLEHLGDLVDQERALEMIQGAMSFIDTKREGIVTPEGHDALAQSTFEVAQQNYVAADCRVRDADIAQEVAEMVRLQVLHQADAAILAQANQRPRSVFGLL